MNEIIYKILKVAVHAPSGHNFQPWRFEIEGDTLSIFNLPQRDTTLFNFKQRGSFMAHGALLENISIAAPFFGLWSEISVFPELNNEEHIAQIQFRDISLKRSDLYEVIKQRVTNRKPYQKLPLKQEHRISILEVARELRGNLLLIEDPEKVKELVKAFSLTDKLLFQNKRMHQSLFPHIRWFAQQAQKSPGLYIETFELPLIIKLMFYIFTFWPIAKFFGILGFGNIGAKQNQKIYNSCSAIGLITIPSDAPQDFLEAGRVMQRVWLLATKIGLSMHPVTGIIHLAERVKEENPSWFTAKEKLQIKRAYEIIKDIFGVKSGTMALTFRLGYAEPPSAHSFYLEPLITYK